MEREFICLDETTPEEKERGIRKITCFMEDRRIEITLTGIKRNEDVIKIAERIAKEYKEKISI